jgi:hypothetical protein
MSTREAEKVIYFENYLVIEYPVDGEESEEFEKDEKTISLNEEGEIRWVKLHRLLIFMLNFLLLNSLKFFKLLKKKVFFIYFFVRKGLFNEKLGWKI